MKTLLDFILDIGRIYSPLFLESGYYTVLDTFHLFPSRVWTLGKTLENHSVLDQRKIPWVVAQRDFQQIGYGLNDFTGFWAGKSYVGQGSTSGPRTHLGPKKVLFQISVILGRVIQPIAQDINFLAFISNPRKIFWGSQNKFRPAKGVSHEKCLPHEEQRFTLWGPFPPGGYILGHISSKSLAHNMLRGLAKQFFLRARIWGNLL